MVCHQPVGADEVQTLRGGPVRLVYGVVHLLNEDRQGHVKVQTAGLGHFLTLIVALVLAEEDTLSNVAIGLAAVGGMGFLDVN